MKKILFTVIAAVLSLTACSSGRVDSVVLVTVDGLSAKDADTFASLNKNAAIFYNAITPCPVTLPATATIMTGLHPLKHGVAGSENWRLEDAAATMGEMFQSRLWRTAAFIGGSDLGPETGVNQGFDAYQYDFTSVPAGPFAYPVFKNASSISDKAIKWLGLFGDKPFFIWVHYGDLVEDWATPLEEADRKKRLDEVVAALDKLIAFLPEKGRRSLIILTSPAANAMGDHGELGHGVFLYNSTLRIPLVINGPAVSNRRLDSPVSLEDIFPTVMSLINFPQPQNIQGVDLTPILRSGKDTQPDRERFVITREPLLRWGLSPLRALVKGKLKLIEDSMNHVELYNRESDPGELSNISGTEPKIIEEMRKSLAAFEESVKVDKSMAKSLLPVADIKGPLPAPMNKIKALQLFGKAAVLFNKNNTAEAYPILTEAISIHPENKRIVVALALAAQSSQPENVSLKMWETAANLNPGDPMVLTSLAQARKNMGDFSGALAALDKALETEVENPDAHMLATDILMDNAARLKGQARKEALEKALKHIILAIRSDGSNAKAYYKAGEILLGMAELTKTLPPSSTSGGRDERLKEAKAMENGARKTFEQALGLDPNLAEAHLSLARLLAAENEPAAAKEHIEKYLKLAPQGPGAIEAQKILKALPPSQPPPKNK